MAGKGDERRPAAVTREELQRRFEKLRCGDGGDYHRHDVDGFCVQCGRHKEDDDGST